MYWSIYSTYFVALLFVLYSCTLYVFPCYCSNINSCSILCTSNTGSRCTDLSIVHTLLHYCLYYIVVPCLVFLVSILISIPVPYCVGATLVQDVLTLCLSCKPSLPYIDRRMVSTEASASPWMAPRNPGRRLPPALPFGGPAGERQNRIFGARAKWI